MTLVVFGSRPLVYALIEEVPLKNDRILKRRMVRVHSSIEDGHDRAFPRDSQVTRLRGSNVRGAFKKLPAPPEIKVDRVHLVHSIQRLKDRYVFNLDNENWKPSKPVADVHPARFHQAPLEIKRGDSQGIHVGLRGVRVPCRPGGGGVNGRPRALEIDEHHDLSLRLEHGTYFPPHPSPIKGLSLQRAPDEEGAQGSPHGQEGRRSHSNVGTFHEKEHEKAVFAGTQSTNL